MTTASRDNYDTVTPTLAEERSTPATSTTITTTATTTPPLPATTTTITTTATSSSSMAAAETSMTSSDISNDGIHADDTSDVVKALADGPDYYGLMESMQRDNSTIHDGEEGDDDEENEEEEDADAFLMAVNDGIDRGARIPYRELPPCHVKCFDSEAYKAWLVHDVRTLSIRDFCWWKRFSVENWMIHHLKGCVHNNCRKRDAKDSQAWMRKYCLRG
ncbi:hypothetical protein GGR56DRAFT_676210 [Xylariaceae sp. FL0804]|nr:hypothetical protein GGR56DRAFT_676210 [Xylariaceae sp. FL0804]